MQFLRLLAAALLVAALASCSSGSKFRTYNGPEVTQIIVYKAERRMELWHHNRMLRSFRVDLGGNPFNHKERRGDRRTPEGDYLIDRRNPNSRFHLSIGIDYPNAADRTFAAENGWDPGGDIFIHGRGPEFPNARGDWTDGCIAVTDREMEDIYAMVRIGTPIRILASRAAVRPAPLAPPDIMPMPLAIVQAPVPLDPLAVPPVVTEGVGGPPLSVAALAPALSPTPPERPGILSRMTGGLFGR
ncbi:MAG: L,D-transpeptidase family protein [Roseinatronobacter sp.]